MRIPDGGQDNGPGWDGTGDTGNDGLGADTRNGELRRDFGGGNGVGWANSGGGSTSVASLMRSYPGLSASQYTSLAYWGVSTYNGQIGYMMPVEHISASPKLGDLGSMLVTDVEEGMWWVPVGADFEIINQYSGGPGPNGPHTNVTGGQTLYSIAKKYGTSVRTLKKINNMTGNNIQVGQNLKVGETISQVFNNVMNIEIEYSYKGRGDAIRLALRDTPFGEWLQGGYDSWYRWSENIDFLDFKSSGTAPYLNHSEWLNLNWRQRAEAFDRFK